jgi:hypothetical protein
MKMEKELTKVAELWADQIMNGRWDNGEPTHNVLGSLLRASAAKPTQEQIDIFKRTLIEECVTSFTSKGHGVNLGVDYQADAELIKSCEAAGISTELLPVKSFVFAGPGKVSYKFGYGSRIVDINVKE